MITNRQGSIRGSPMGDTPRMFYARGDPLIYYDLLNDLPTCLMVIGNLFWIETGRVDLINGDLIFCKLTGPGWPDGEVMAEWKITFGVYKHQKWRDDKFSFGVDQHRSWMDEVSIRIGRIRFWVHCNYIILEIRTIKGCGNEEFQRGLFYNEFKGNCSGLGTKGYSVI